MSAARAAKRHPRPPVEELLTSRKDVIEFSMFLRTDPDFCIAVTKTAETVRKNEAIVAEHKRRQALPKWRRFLLHLWREW